jgi:hypothetical protein
MTSSRLSAIEALPEGTRPESLGENQLSWCRLNLPKFRDMERAARAAIRDTEASKRAHPSASDLRPKDGE